MQPLRRNRPLDRIRVRQQKATIEKTVLHLYVVYRVSRIAYRAMETIILTGASCRSAHAYSTPVACPLLFLFSITRVGERLLGCESGTNSRTRE